MEEVPIFNKSLEAEEAESAVNKKRDRIKYPKCMVHKKDIVLHCETDDIGLCTKCVPAHCSHPMFEIKDKCAELMKPWTDLKSHLSKLRNKLEPNIAKISEKDLASLDSNIAKFHVKFNELLEHKRNCNFKDLQNIKDASYLRYEEKTVNFAKRLNDSIEPPEEKKSLLSKRS